MGTAECVSVCAGGRAALRKAESWSQGTPVSVFGGADVWEVWANEKRGCRPGPSPALEQPQNQGEAASQPHRAEGERRSWEWGGGAVRAWLGLEIAASSPSFLKDP